jgi:iron complex outermembrane receptor protein
MRHRRELTDLQPPIQLLLSSFIHHHCRDRPIGGIRLWLIAAAIFASRAAAQTPDSLPSGALKRLSLEQLMNIEVTSVSRHPERLSATASAIQVITGEEIRRSGASSVAEALRLAPNLQVAQVNASQWAISARGFTNVLSNKLLVLIDGRTVYTPLYAGVFWDVQNLPVEQVDRIEVISGPGGALWGANAVNGVINIITKSASETQGLALEAGGGTEVQEFGGLRYGGRTSPELAYRVYGHGWGWGSTKLTNGNDAEDSWGMGQTGFRTDWTPRPSDRVTLQSDFNYARPAPDGGSPILAMGGNVVGRWKRAITEGSDFQIQLYYDRTYRDFQNGFTEDLATYDIDGQHRFRLRHRQEITWGLGARLMDHQTTNLSLFEFLPAHRWLHLYSAFVQDELAFADDRWHLTLGSKFEHNDYTGFEVQPSARLAWTPAERTTVWAAVSRAVRTPSRLDRDFYLYAAPSFPVIVGDDLQSEELLAYELGWRFQPDARMSFSLSTFYNDYDHLRSAEPGPPPFNLPITFQNGVAGHTYGVEMAAAYQVSDRWRLRGGYTFLHKKLSVQPGSNDLNQGTAESDDPAHQILLQSTADLPGGLEFDATVRYVDILPKPPVPSYVDLGLRLGWKPTRHLELAVVGQHLLERRHAEFMPTSPSPREIERGIYGQVTWR